MKLEDLCVSLELAKALVGNGYPQEATFYFVPEEFEDRPQYQAKLIYEAMGEHKNLIAAPTSSEIGEQLKAFPMISYGYYPNVWITQIPRDENRSPVWTPAFTEYSEADSRAKMWLFLKQENLLQSSQENK
jgi:hypothetical protein